MKTIGHKTTIAAHYVMPRWHIKEAITLADCCDWLLNIGWFSGPELAKREAPVAHYRLSEMTGRRGEWTVNGHLLCIRAFNWAFRAGIINMQLQSLWECAGEVRPCVCVCLVCVCAWLITHLCPLSEPRPFSPLCALGEWGDKRPI